MTRVRYARARARACVCAQARAGFGKGWVEGFARTERYSTFTFVSSMMSDSGLACSFTGVRPSQSVRLQSAAQATQNRRKGPASDANGELAMRTSSLSANRSEFRAELSGDAMYSSRRVDGMAWGFRRWLDDGSARSSKNFSPPPLEKPDIHTYRYSSMS